MREFGGPSTQAWILVVKPPRAMVRPLNFIAATSVSVCTLFLTEGHLEKPLRVWQDMSASNLT
jgi:hypothetical protein